jgi:hypothetical protein
MVEEIPFSTNITPKEPPSYFFLRRKKRAIRPLRESDIPNFAAVMSI